MKKMLWVCLLFLTAFAVSGCDKEEDDSIGTGTSFTKKIDAPTVSISTSTSTTSDFTVVLKIQSDEMPTSVKLHYGRNTKKTSDPIINKVGNCTFTQKAGSSTYYYKSTHTGFNGGNYIYFYGEVQNSGGKSKTDVRYVIIKR